MVITESNGKARFVQIPLNDACTGMILSEDVVVSNGIVLHRLDKLDRSLITLLRNSGITKVSVFQDENCGVTTKTDNSTNKVEYSLIDGGSSTHDSVDSHEWYSSQKSLDNQAKTIPLEVRSNFNGIFGIEISTDHMVAKCNIVPPGPEGILPAKQEILNRLHDMSVCFGISENDIDTMLILCSQGNFPTEPVVIARGLPPINGEDGTFICHFNTNMSLAPSINSDGSADYRSVNIVATVRSKQKLATLIPPGIGHDGSDVYGRLLPAQPGKPAKLPQGTNTIPDPDNPTDLIANLDGVVRVNGGLIEVCEGLIVQGDVDFSTGNIEYEKTVVVNGDVKAGFNLRTGADLQVNGTIEDCHIVVNGNVLCRCGFVGQGKGYIEAKGDVNISFIKNQYVTSFRSINVAKEAINSTLHSRTSIIVHGRPLSVAGGELKAKAITVYTVGNHTGIRTLLEAGVDFLMVDELDMIEKQIVEITSEFKVITEAFSRIKNVLATKKKTSNTEQDKYRELSNALRLTRQKLTVLEERKSIVSKKLFSTADARIIIQHAAYPGTLFKIGNRHHLLQEELVGPKTIIYAHDDISIV